MIDILLIDDDEDEYVIFSEAISLIEASLRCTYVPSAEEAIKILQKVQPQIIMVDMNMPMTNGIECIRKIKAIKKENTPVLVLYSTNIDDRTWKSAMMAGAAHRLQKTGSIPILAEKLLPLLSI